MIIAKKLKVIVSGFEPWDWYDFAKEKQQSAQVLLWKIDDGGKSSQIMFELDIPVVYKEGMACRYFVGGPRHEGDCLDQILAGDEIVCSMIRISEERAMGSDPFDLSWWRGWKHGVGVIFTIRRKE